MWRTDLVECAETPGDAGLGPSRIDAVTAVVWRAHSLLNVSCIVACGVYLKPDNVLLLRIKTPVFAV